jgi:antitoxin component YwqK of YwqJK toxin-antitoxin module
MRSASAFFLLLAACFLPADEAWYESNSIGSALRPIEAGENADSGYVLFTQSVDGEETRRLFDSDKKEVRRWERRYTETGLLEEERVFEDGVEDSLTRYYPSGLVKEEVLFKDGREEGRFIFTYPGEEPSPGAGSLKTAPHSVVFSRPETDFRDEYRYLPSGEFRGVKRIYADGQEYSSVFVATGGILFEEWHCFDALEILFRYDTRGRLRYTEEYRGGVLVERGGFRYDESQNPFRIREKTTWRIGEGRRIRQEYGDEGLLLRESVFEEGARVAVTLFTYEEKLMKRREKRERRGREEWEYFYNEDKDLVRENYSRDGELQKILYHDPDPEHSRVEEYYRDGELFLRLYFRDGEIVERQISGEDDL